MSALTRQTNKLAEVAKYPATYVLMAVVGLMGFFAHKMASSQGDRSDDCKEEVRYLRGQLARKDSLIENQAFTIRVQDATIQQLPAVADSVLQHSPKPSTP